MKNLLLDHIEVLIREIKYTEIFMKAFGLASFILFGASLEYFFSHDTLIDKEFPVGDLLKTLLGLFVPFFGYFTNGTNPSKKRKLNTLRYLNRKPELLSPDDIKHIYNS